MSLWIFPICLNLPSSVRKAAACRSDEMASSGFTCRACAYFRGGGGQGMSQRGGLGTDARQGEAGLMHDDARTFLKQLAASCAALAAS